MPPRGSRLWGFVYVPVGVAVAVPHRLRLPGYPVTAPGYTIRERHRVIPSAHHMAAADGGRYA